MAVTTGDDVVEMFKNLNIDMGDLNSNVVRGWFDTNCKDTKNFLTWLCTSFDKTNVLTALECEEYDYLATKNSILAKDQLEKEITAIEKKMPGILDVTEAQFDVEIMNEEVKVLLAEEEEQNNLLNTYKNVHRHFNKEIAKAHNKEAEKNLEKERAFEKCLTFSKNLDEANKKLSEMIHRYKTNLDNFEYATVPLFFASMDLDQYKKNYFLFEKNCHLKEKNSFLNNDAFCFNASSMKISSNSCQMEELEIIQNRILKSQKKCLTLKVDKIQMEAALEKLKSICSADESLNINSYSMDVEKTYQVEKQDRIQRIFEILLGLMERVSLSQVFFTKIEIIKADIETKLQKFHKLDSFHETISAVLRNQILIEMFLNAEGDIVNDVFLFLRSVNHYINKDMHCCQLRMTKILQDIEENKTRKSVPIEKCHRLIESVKLLLSDGNEKEYTLQEIFNLMSNFIAEQNRVEHQLLTVDYENHRILCQPLEKEIKALQKFLHNEACNQLLLIPHEIQKWIITMESLLQKKKNEILSLRQAETDAKKKLPQTKWNVMQRHLWMYFMEGSQVVLQAIKEIQQATKNVI